MAQTKITSTLRRIQQADDTLSIQDMLMLCLRHWPWFIFSMIVFMGATTLYLKSVPREYTRTMSIRVNTSGGKSQEMQAFEALGVNNLSSEIADEIVTIHSPAAVFDMVKRLHLDVNYYRKGVFRDDPLYGPNLPVEVVFHELDDNAPTDFTLTLNGDGTATLSDIAFEGKKWEKTCHVTIGKEGTSPMGKFTVTPTASYKATEQTEILVRRAAYWQAANYYGARIFAMAQEEASNIINLGCLDQSIPRAENILKTLVAIYNENWVQSRNQISVSTNKFIMERLAIIEEELGDVEKNISNYLSAHAMPSVDAVSGVAFTRENTTDLLQEDLNNQLYMARYVRAYITDSGNNLQLLPAGTGIGVEGVETQIAEYNKALLERSNLLANSSEQNPLVADLDVQLKNLKAAILTSLDNAQKVLEIQLKTAQKAHSKAVGKLTETPDQANYLLSYERQQKVKESLYLFLLQKREENELSQAFTAYNTRILAAPYGSNEPTSPRSKRILMIAFAISMTLPATFFILRESMNTKVRGRKDLENMSIPYVGELPLWRGKKEDAGEEYQIVVQQHKRDLVNEAFRVVRTNLEFMTNAEKQCKIVMLTSFNPGSGKTFITANLGTSFGIRGSRVICIDLDLRRASLSEYVNSPKQGITDYLGGHVDDYHPLIVHREDATIDILPVGKVPPNPTELLYSPKLKPMLDELRQQYDYIFVDCPPVEIVADATIVSHEADVTLFIVRAGLLERNMLPELEKDYEEKKYNNMAMLLNGTDATNTYGYHRYGYGYGRYGYGKRYGYGYYGSGKKKKKK